MTCYSDTVPTCPILGVTLRATDYQGVIASVSDAIDRRQQLRLNFCNVHVTMMAQRNRALRESLNHPDALTVPDGMPLVWAMRSWGATLDDRVYGPDTFELCLERFHDRNVRHYFYGSSDETREKLMDNIQSRFPEISIAGSYSPPFRELRTEEEDAVVESINAAEPDIVWVGLGAPRQEIWIDRMAPRLDVPVLAAVGAAFDFHAGTVKQAPDWMQSRGLEWLYRFLQEPRRLWFRYGVYNPLFVISFAWERLTGRRHISHEQQHESR